MVARHKTNVGQIPVTLRVVHPVANDKKIGNRKSNVVGLNLFDAARRFVEERGNPQSLRMLLEKQLAQIGKRQSSVEYVLDNQHVLPLDGLIQVLDQFDGAR